MSKVETIRRLLIGDLRRIFRHRYGVTLPDDDAGRDDLETCCSPHSVSPRAAERRCLEVEIFAPWMPEPRRRKAACRSISESNEVSSSFG